LNSFVRGVMLEAVKYAGCLFVMAAMVFAQQPGHVGGGISLVRPGGSHMRMAPRANFGRQLASPAFPIFFGDYDYGYPAYSPAPSVVIVQQPPSYVVIPERPPETAKMEMHEYNAPAAEPPPSKGEAAAFALAYKDGSVHSAVAVTMQNDFVNYVDPDGRYLRVKLSAIDREATRRMNRERSLTLQLPAPDR
jgi:hypothetical protein